MEQSTDLRFRPQAFAFHRHGRNEVVQGLVACLYFEKSPSPLAYDLEVRVDVADDVRYFYDLGAITELLKLTLVRFLTGSVASPSTALQPYRSYGTRRVQGVTSTS
jgi:hypothetical protein